MRRVLKKCLIWQRKRDGRSAQSAAKWLKRLLDANIFMQVLPNLKPGGNKLTPRSVVAVKTSATGKQNIMTEG